MSGRSIKYIMIKQTLCSSLEKGKWILAPKYFFCMNIDRANIVSLQTKILAHLLLFQAK